MTAINHDITGAPITVGSYVQISGNTLVIGLVTALDSGSGVTVNYPTLDGLNTVTQITTGLVVIAVPNVEAV